MLRSIQIFTRKREADLRQLFPVTNERLRRFSQGTEGGGVYGEDNPLTHDAMNALENAISLVEDLLHYNPPEEIPTILNDLDIMMADAVIRAHNLLGIQSVVPVEPWMKGSGLLPPEGEEFKEAPD
jgi:hypothetical protein